MARSRSPSRLLERLLAVHHPGAGCLAQRGDVLRRDLSHRSLLLAILRRALGSLGAAVGGALGLRGGLGCVGSLGRVAAGVGRGRGGLRLRVQARLALALRGGGRVAGRLLLGVALGAAPRA